MANRITDNNLKFLVEDFVSKLVSAVESYATQRVQNAVLTALGSATSSFGAPRRRGRPPKNAGMHSSTDTGLFPLTALSSSDTPDKLLAPVRRRPKQFCPVPGCTNVAAPLYGMVCSKHKDLPKPQIKKYRADRKAAKEKAA